jgi:hypothetical protein
MLKNSPRLIAIVLVSMCLLGYWRLTGPPVVDRRVPVVLVALFDQSQTAEQGPIIEKVLENRAEYAKAHGTPLTRLDY